MRNAFTDGASHIAAATALLSGGAALAQNPSQTQPSPDDRQIVVTANRPMIAALRGINPERAYDQTDVQSYGDSTVGEVIDDIRAENGDDQAIFLINGEPVSDIDDVTDYPAEAADRLEVLPRGSGQKIGREADRRIYNVVLKKQLRSLTLTAGRKEATEGDWGESNGEAILTRIAGRQRINLTLRARDSQALTEADREIVQPDPATVTSIADSYEPVDPGFYRTLRGPTRNYEASLIGGAPLAPGITSSFSFVGRLDRNRSLSGLPYAVFLLPGASPYSTTGVDQRLVLSASDPLRNRSLTSGLNANATINATRGSWIASVTGQLKFSHQHFQNELPDTSRFTQPIIVPGGRDPFADPLDDFLSTRIDNSVTDQRAWLVKLNVGGPVVHLPAGQLRVRGVIQREGDRSHSVSDDGFGTTDQLYKRSATLFDGGIDIPLASHDFLAPLGQLTLSLDRGHSTVDRMPGLDRSSLTALWQPSQRVSVTAFAGHSDELPAIGFLSGPSVRYENVRTYDFLIGDTVDVTVVEGANPNLRAISKRTRRLSLNVAPWPRYNLQINADYESNRVRNFVATVPAASTPVFLAFPERFQRDASGKLVLVDTRPVNFDHEATEQLRYGASFFIPLGPATPLAIAGGGGAGSQTFRPTPVGARPRLEVTFSHTIVFRDRILIRPGLPIVDLLEGGAVGIAGGRARHIVAGSIALTKAGTGARLTGLYRSASTLLSGTPTVPETLRFAPIFTASLRVYADLQPLLPGAQWLKDTRLSLTVENLGDRRQRVLDRAGLTPLRYQAPYLDPVGRTVGIELRKVF